MIMWFNLQKYQFYMLKSGEIQIAYKQFIHQKIQFVPFIFFSKFVYLNFGEK